MRKGKGRGKAAWNEQEAGFLLSEGCFVSIVRVGLAETKGFAEGYDAIFGKKKEEDQQEKTEAKQEQEKKEEPSQNAK